MSSSDSRTFSLVVRPGDKRKRQGKQLRFLTEIPGRKSREQMKSQTNKNDSKGDVLKKKKWLTETVWAEVKSKANPVTGLGGL
jgi:hypothetical protein